MTHQWLATWFIPENIIIEVMTKRYLMNQKQEGIVSNWDGAWEEKEEETAETPKDKFYAMFSELDESEFERFLADNPEYLENGYDEINIDLIGEPSQTHYDTGLKTKQGDTVLAVNAAHGILIVEQTGEDTLGMEYAGKIALCKKPENIYVGTSEGLGDYGSFVSDMVRDYDAILGINASGFADFDGNGTGGTVYGFLKSQGEKYQDAVGNGWKIIGFDNEDHLQVGAFNDTSSLRDAVEFHPALIINGENLGLGGYLDIGLIDTMKDLLVNFVGAVVFSVAGYFYARSKGKKRAAALNFVPSKKNEDHDYLQQARENGPDLPEKRKK